MRCATNWPTSAGTSIDGPAGSRLTRREAGRRPTSIRSVRRPPLPTFLTDLDREPGAVQTLVAASLALLAAGLAPRIFSPGLASVQSAVRERPEIEALLLVASIVTAGMLLVGGVLGDADGRRRVMLVALGGLVVTGIGGLFFADGPLFVVGRFVDVGRREHRPAGRPGRCGDHASRASIRATAIGLAYGAYGAATARLHRSC